MSASIEVALHCDAEEECIVSYHRIFDEAGLHPETKALIEDARYKAALLGWDHLGGRDICPLHAGIA